MNFFSQDIFGDIYLNTLFQAYEQATRGGGGTVEGGVLHEVKIISCNKTRYDPNSPKLAVDARADLLPQEYLNKTRAADQKYNNTERGTVGPVEKKLLELGKV